MPDLPVMTIDQEKYDTIMASFEGDEEQYKEWLYGLIVDGMVARELAKADQEYYSNRESRARNMRDKLTGFTTPVNPAGPVAPTPVPPAAGPRR